MTYRLRTAAVDFKKEEKSVWGLQVFMAAKEISFSTYCQLFLKFHMLGWLMEKIIYITYIWGWLITCIELFD